MAVPRHLYESETVVKNNENVSTIQAVTLKFLSVKKYTRLDKIKKTFGSN
jgi:hypothetical protein